MPNKKEDFVKIVLLGDSQAGKSSLCLSYDHGYFPRWYIPRNFDMWLFEIVIAGETFTHGLYDTSREGDDYFHLRPRSYPHTDVFLMCFSVECRSSFERIESRWLPEIRHHMPTTPIILVATKIDLRGNSQHNCITFDEGLKLAQKHNLTYTETSAVLHIIENTYEFPLCGAAPCSWSFFLSYEEVDVFHLYFSVQSRTSLANVETRWVPEIRHAMPDIPILLVATNIDPPWSPHRKRVVTYEEGLKMAQKLNLEYTEMTGQLKVNVKECLQKAVYIGYEAKQAKRRKKGFFGFRGRKPKPRPPPEPEVPPVDEAPRIEIQTSTIADDFGKALEQAAFSDVIFIIEGKSILAHKVVLCSASNFFCCVFGLDPPDQDTASHPSVMNFTWEDINQGKITGLAGIRDEVTPDGSLLEKAKTRVMISADISYQTFQHVLKFLYTGLPSITDGTSTEDLVALQKASNTFSLPMLDSIVKNLQNDGKFLNPSIGTYLNDQTGQRAKWLFLNKQTLSDIQFKVEDTTVYAHKVMLTSRCGFMNGMFSGDFTESSQEEIRIEDVSLECFLALLEYLYTDHAPIEEGDAVGILVAADRYGQDRLRNLCEMYITKGVDVTDKHVDVIGLLHTAQIYNASQLAQWCLDLISRNFVAFRKRAEFKKLEGENLKYVTENRWPPVSYLDELEKYKAQCGEKVNRV
ncbi:rho-related protein racA-like isoform X2 [Acanthaster planci]|uniref:Rho-related protein racA-like isoform X2 n=1 Tax=Acanthaster planci TaxID=133434 RepID=A0A8B7YT19_ACAPL|nr:rho-related protein racA-like isoform X2 [Acanthaster planci]